MRIEGLETLDYLDNLSKRELLTEQGDAITFESEVKPLKDSAIIHTELVSSLGYLRLDVSFDSDGPDLP